MISFNYETDFVLEDDKNIIRWIRSVIVSEKFIEGDINYIFCDDDYLHKINIDFLNHDSFTDIISFDYSIGKKLQGDIFISVERVKENAKEFSTSFQEEIHRVMVHGILHYCGYKDKTDEEVMQMRSKENFYLKQR
jgi:rRNA maturation RNase YbeY